MLLFAGCLINGDGERPPYLPEDGDEPCELTTSSYRIETMQLPSSSADSERVGFNLDADEQGRPDNAAGTLYGVLWSQSDTASEDLPAALEQSFTGNDVVWVLQVSTCADSDGPQGYAEVSALRGRDADGDGRVELIDAASTPATGYKINDVILAQRGEGAAPISKLVDVLGTADPVWGDANGLAVELTVDDQGKATGRIGFGVPADQIALVAPPLAAFFTTWLEADKSDFAAEADTDGDGTVSPSEFRATLLYGAMFVPDVDLYASYAGEQVYWPRHDGVDDHLSFAAKYTATPVEVE